MEAARVAAERGHEVMLLEKGQRLGGMLLSQDKMPHKPRLAGLIEYLKRQVKNAGVEIKLNEECSSDSIRGLDPDVVIVASGSNAVIPDIPGIEMEHVITATDLLYGRKQAGKRVVIIGGGLVACDTAQLLASEGKKVTIIEVLSSIAPEMYSFQSHEIGCRLGTKGVVMMTKVKGEEITETGVVVTDAWGQVHTIAADTVVVATGQSPNDALVKEIEGMVPELYAIGDCLKPRKIINAIHEGAEIGYQI